MKFFWTHINHMLNSEIQLTTLSNGIRVAHKQVSSTRIVHCGFTLDIGSRDEQVQNQGIAHFWEHMAFKGTRKRKAYHILNRLDSRGGELNAFTTKEKISFYASALDTHFEKAFELLTDITFDSIFPENQIEREKGVILEEMAMYRDSPDDALQDEFDGLVFKDHPLGYNILGTDQSIKSFHKNDFTDFLSGRLNTEKIVFSSVGNVSFKKVIRLAEKYLSALPHISNSYHRDVFDNFIPDQKVITKEITQSLCSIGRTSYPISNPARLPFVLLTNLLGGPAMNSRLNMSLRERKGFVYSIDANYSPFTDTGLFSIQFGTDQNNLNKSIDMVFRELANLKNKKLGTKQIHEAREQLKGQLAMAEENNAGFMLMMGKSLLDTQKIDPLELIFREIEGVDGSKILELSNEMFDNSSLSILTFMPEKIP